MHAVISRDGRRLPGGDFSCPDISGGCRQAIGSLAMAQMFRRVTPLTQARGIMIGLPAQEKEREREISGEGRRNEVMPRADHRIRSTLTFSCDRGENAAEMLPKGTVFE